MADKMDVEAVNGAKEAERVGPAPDLAADRIITNNFALLNSAVDAFDPRFTLRALRSISTLRKAADFPDALAIAIRTAFPRPQNNARRVLEEMLPERLRGEQGTDNANGGAASKDPDLVEIAEVWAYLGVLCQVYLYDTQQYDKGASFSDNFVEKVRSFNRRTMDPIGAKAYFYYQLFHEHLAPLPPSKQSPVIDIRPRLLAALRSAVLRKDPDTHAAVTVLLLRNYLSTADITQADLLVAQTQFPSSAANTQVCRYLYHLGRIRAIQLAYTDAHANLESATRKSPTTGPAAGFYQQATKLRIVVELLMGDIPPRSLFRHPTLEAALAPYLPLVHAVRIGDLQAFLATTTTHAALFRADGTATLIARLRQNVLKTGIRMLSLAYSRISLREICRRLGISTEESAEYIAAKAIRDGVIPSSSLDHAHGHLATRLPGEAYTTTEPCDAFHSRVEALLAMRDESVRAMRYPVDKHRRVAAEAALARERERELETAIAEGDEEDLGDDGEGGF
ncbi:hypothetical protein B0A50_05164 [Salinomyces thailandicus]|uniref:PCI domain-containing protein n=1 Tax=Salinomyces thailandicus TaxID=706561 RepID=A0A4U0TX06_9PEZI|nr:hypothetical protein B0A50_05164 [Salinomyces thailandica]